VYKIIKQTEKSSIDLKGLWMICLSLALLKALRLSAERQSVLFAPRRVRGNSRQLNFWGAETSQEILKNC